MPFRSPITRLGQTRLRTQLMLTYALVLGVDKFQLFPVGRTLIFLIEFSGHFAAADNKESSPGRRAGYPV